MAKTKISEYSATAGSNTDINSINLAEGMAPSLVNNAIRQLMAQLKDFQAGTAGDSVTVGGNLSVTGTSTLTGAITATGGVSGAITSSSATITGGTITGITDLAVADGGTGASTAANARTNLSAAASGANSDITSITGLTTALTVLQGGTGVTTSTGTGNVVLSTSPTLVTPALGTPSALVGTNITGTASGLTAGNVTTNANLTGGVTSVGNAATVVTNANLTGAVTSVGNATSLGSFTSANLLAALTDETGTGSAVFATSPTLVTPALGTPSALVGTNITGTAAGLTAGNVTTNANLTGAITSVGNATSLGSFTSANLLAALTDETGTGSAVFATSPTLVTPILGTPTSATLTNATGLPISTGVSGLGTGVATFLGTPSSANLISAVTDETGTGSLVFATSPTLVTPALGTPSALVGTNITGTAAGLTAGNVTTNANLTGAITSTGNATSLGSFSSANLLSALTDETGTGVVVFATSPTLVTPILGTPTSATLTNATGLPLTTGVTGQLPVANGGTGTATPSIVAGTNVTVTGTWPNQTIASSGSGGGVSYTAVKTANYTAANNDGVLTNTTGGAFTVTLPTSPSVGNIVLVIDSFSQWGTNNLTIDPTALIKIAGNTAGDTLVCDITGATVTLVYTGATYGWNVAAQVGGNGGTAVTLTGTQTLTNKTLTSPVLTTPTLGVATGTSFQGIIGNVTPAAGNFTTLGATGVATFSAGTAALPALTTSGDTNTGIFFPAADEISFSEGGSEAMRIDSSGNLLVGTTVASGNPTQGAQILINSGESVIVIGHVTATPSGILYAGFSYAGSRIGSITQSGTTAVAYNTSSDYRLKNTIAPMTGALAKVALLKPCTYKWNADGSDGEGFIAHELAEVCPHAVTGEKDAIDEDGKINPQGIDTSFLVATLTAAMQEQQALITSLTERITALEGV